MQESVLHLSGWWGGAIEQRHLSTEILRVNFSFHQPSELSLGGELGIRKEEVSLDRRACGSCDDSLTPPATNQGYGSSRFLPPLLQFDKQSAIVHRCPLLYHRTVCCITLRGESVSGFLVRNQPLWFLPPSVQSLISNCHSSSSF